MEKKEQFDLSDDYPNTYGRSEVTCPFCGEEQGDSWEIKSNDGTEKCDCGKEFEWVRNITVEYESNPIGIHE